MFVSFPSTYSIHLLAIVCAIISVQVIAHLYFVGESVPEGKMFSCLQEQSVYVNQVSLADPLKNYCTLV
jgi:hypothetical protein